jgi:hypothetical protein
MATGTGAAPDIGQVGYALAVGLRLFSIKALRKR